MPHVLIIDDEEDIRTVASLSLETTEDWQVSTAGSGYEGLEMARKLKPDAILMDVMMPGMDGPAAVRELQKDPEIASIPVILLTAKVQGVDLRRFADLGVAAVLNKPFDPMALGRQMAEILGWE